MVFFLTNKRRAQFAKAMFLMQKKNSLVKMSDLIDPAITAVWQGEINCKYLPALPSTGSDYLELSFF